MYIKTLDDKNFDNELMNSNGFFLIDFWADWCNPCMALLPILEELSVEYKGVILFGKINVDINLDIPKRYNVMSIPTLILFKDGVLVDRKIGSVSKLDILNFIDLNR
ncbi:thioredoxin [Candidatus Legionella polyplacis]|uniref:Thioredoxin n=1 Tax=Candidatus Legionella polyplacis TaxID=2005262 RepID=A0ABZ2GYQ8_9GAMM|nr:thioredoxin [Candidatus Legionella polyplacis]